MGIFIYILKVAWSSFFIFRCSTCDETSLFD